jgi:hypothetical protein
MRGKRVTKRNVSALDPNEKKKKNKKEKKKKKIEKPIRNTSIQK